jgi:hypothetical protein
MVLFLNSGADEQVPTNRTDKAEHRGWKPSNPMGSMNASVVWIDGDQLYCFTQLMNPGPGVLFASRDSEAGLRDRVAEIDGIQESMTAAIAVQDGRERAERLKPYVVSDVFPAQQSSLEELGRSGPSAAPTIIGMLDDPTLADEASEFGEGPRQKECHCSLAYSALACFRMGIVGSASLHSARKS